jgi:hypothetical protein
MQARGTESTEGGSKPISSRKKSSKILGRGAREMFSTLWHRHKAE